MQPSIQQFERSMHSVGEGHKGDTIALDLNAGAVDITFRGQPIGTVQDPAFAAALMSVWLGDKPAQESLKKALLGQG